MSTQYESLLTPLKIGDFTIKNRITMASLTRNRALDSYPTDVMKEYYVQRANAGLITTEGVLITPQGLAWPHAPGIWDNKHVEKWKDIVDGVHAAGGKIFAQLWHVGRAAHPDMPLHKLAGTPVYAPSALKARGGKFRLLPGSPGFVTPTAIDDPRKLIALYKQAALNAKKAGFDGVELIANGGYLVHEFLDSTANHRTDEWGGSKENRARFLLETLQTMQEVYGNNVGLKISPTGGYNDMGMPLQETLDSFSYYFSEVDKLGLAYIILMRYTEFLDIIVDGVSRATRHDVLAAYRPFVKNTPLILNGGLTPEEGAELVKSGQIDGVAFGFNWITHPDLVKRLEHGRPLDNELQTKHLYTGVGDDWGKGYTDYPSAIY